MGDDVVPWHMCSTISPVSPAAMLSTVAVGASCTNDPHQSFITH